MINLGKRKRKQKKLMTLREFNRKMRKDREQQQRCRQKAKSSKEQ